MLVRVVEPPQREEQKARVVLRVGAQARASRRFEVVTGGVGVFDEGAVGEVFMIGPFAQFFKDDAEVSMELALEATTITRLEERCGVAEDIERGGEAHRREFDHGAAEQDNCLEMPIFPVETRECLTKQEAGFGEEAFAPVAEGQLALGFSRSRLAGHGLKYAKAFADEILGDGLRPTRLPATAYPAGERPGSEQHHLGGGARVQFIRLRALGSARPPLAEHLSCSLEVACLFEFSRPLTAQMRPL